MCCACREEPPALDVLYLCSRIYTAAAGPFLDSECMVMELFSCFMSHNPRSTSKAHLWILCSEFSIISGPLTERLFNLLSVTPADLALLFYLIF